MHENYFFYKDLDNGYITNCTAIQIGDYYAISPFVNHGDGKKTIYAPFKVEVKCEGYEYILNKVCTYC